MKSLKTLAALLAAGALFVGACKPKTAAAPAENAAAAPQSEPTHEPDQNAAIGHESRISVDAVAKMVAAKDPHTPKILQIGFPDFYKNGHIPGSLYGGEGSSREGIISLGAMVKDWDRKTPIAIYCGCCPWEHCPNVLPAFKKLKSMGFTDVKAIEIHQDFDTDWMAKLPYESSRKKK